MSPLPRALQITPLTPTHKPPPRIMYTPHRLEIPNIPRDPFDHLHVVLQSLLSTAVLGQFKVALDRQDAASVAQDIRVG